MIEFHNFKKLHIFFALDHQKWCFCNIKKTKQQKYFQCPGRFCTLWNKLSQSEGRQAARLKNKRKKFCIGVHCKGGIAFLFFTSKEGEGEMKKAPSITTPYYFANNNNNNMKEFFYIKFLFWVLYTFLSWNKKLLLPSTKMLFFESRS